MLSTMLITMREALEIALIIGIVVAFLSRSHHARYAKEYARVVWSAVFAAILASGVFAYLFARFAGGFEGRSEMLFEGITMFLAAILIAAMILWMMRQRNVKAGIEREVESDVERKSAFGLFVFVFVSVLREGVETVIFIAAAGAQGYDLAIGVMLGAMMAVAIGFGVYSASVRIDLKRFFVITGILLLFFSAGLVSKGVEEFQEAGVINPLIDHVWDANPRMNYDGTYPLLHDKGVVGRVLVDVFGYDPDPSLAQVGVYVLFLLVVALLWGKDHLFAPGRRNGSSDNSSDD